MLSDGEIETLWRERHLGVEPWDPANLQPASYDLTLGGTLLLPQSHAVGLLYVDPSGGLPVSGPQYASMLHPWEELNIHANRVPKMPANVQYVDNPDDFTGHHGYWPDGYVPGYWLLPGQFILGSTLERLSIPDFCVARIEGKSTPARWGVMVHATAGFVDPGYEGNLTLEIRNIGPFAVLLQAGMKISQLSLEVMRARARNPYKGKYQGSEGVVGGAGQTIIRTAGDVPSVFVVGPDLDTDAGGLADSLDHSRGGGT